MKIVLTGAGGFIGTNLAELLLRYGYNGMDDVDELILIDRQFPSAYIGNNGRVKIIEGEVADPSLMAKAISDDSDWVIHLAATLVVHAEEKFDEGMKINFHSVEKILNICRHAKKKVRFFMPSTIAVFSGALPEFVDDDQPIRPISSYGCEKALCELIMTEYARRGLVDCRSLRLPFVLHRPGLPNGFVSDIVSAITREPLFGRDFVVPWRPDTRMSVASVGHVAASIIAFMNLPEEAFQYRRVINMPGVSVTINEMIDALRQLGGPNLENHLRWKSDEKLQAIVDAWPHHFVSSFAVSNGIRPDASFASMLADFVKNQNISTRILSGLIS